MQLGTLDVLTDKPKEKNLKKELVTGLVSSTVFTVVIVALIHFNVLETPDFFSGKEAVNLSSALPVTLVTSR
jgi:Na+-driven multidrug efflux pump